MRYEIGFTDEFQADLSLHRKAGNTGLLRKIMKFLEELEVHPRSGTGKPERLKYYTEERWSRRIDEKHRLVYEIREKELIVIAVATWGHYTDK